jgi:uncharacterized protein (TIGR03000 family)
MVFPLIRLFVKEIAMHPRGIVSGLAVTSVLWLTTTSLTLGQDTDKKSAHLRLLVPVAAQVAIDGQKTTTTGEERRYETPPLTPGKTYSYQVEASWQEGSSKIVRMAVAKVQAGKETVIDLRPGSKDGSSSQIVYVPTADVVVDKMLEMAKVTKQDVVFDLGCGDGRMVVTAAKKYGARGVGIDLDPKRVKEALANVEKEKLDKLVDIRHGDALKVPDLDQATVVLLYMLPEFMEKLKPIVLKECKPGTRIVAHNYPFPDWEPQRKVTVPNKMPLAPHTLYLWVVGEK